MSSAIWGLLACHAYLRYLIFMIYSRDLHSQYLDCMQSLYRLYLH